MAQRVVDEVPEGLAEPHVVAADPPGAVDVDGDGSTALAGAIREPPRYTAQQLARVEPFGPHGEPSVGRPGDHEQILRELREVVALLERRDERLLHLRVVAAGPQRRL